MAKKNKGGRPTKMTEETIKKLEQGFLYGFSDAEACLHANITTTTLYAYCQKHPDFTDRKEQLKNRPKMQAKMNVMNAMRDGDVKTSTWYLERKAKDEFGNYQELEHSGNMTINFVEDVPPDDDE